MQATQQQLKVYTIYYKDAKGNKFVTHTKLCTKAQALDAWDEFNCFNTFKRTKLIAY